MATIAATTFQYNAASQSLHVTNLNLWNQAMLDAGFVLTSDPQTQLSSYVTDWSRFYRMDDTAQASAPIYIKNTFSTSIGSYVRQSVVAGTGSDGSGSITGPTVSWSHMHSLVAPSYSGVILSSGAEGYAFAGATGVSNAMSTYIHVQRFVDDETGVPNSLGWAIRNFLTGGIHTFDTTTQQWQTNTDITANLSNRSASISPNTFEVMRTWVRGDGRYRCIPSLLHTYQNESVFGTTFTASPLGVQYTYMPLMAAAGGVASSSFAPFGFSNQQTNTYLRPAIRWE